MRRASDFLDIVDATFTQAGKSRALFNTFEDEVIDGRFVQLHGNKLVNFGSCGYVGLEVDPRVKEGIIDATRRYGGQFPSSRAYIQAPLYSEIEELLERIFGAPTLLTASTSLGHLTAIPVFIREDDAVILDQQVHHTVQVATDHVRVQGTHVEMIRHNRMDLLEERILALRGKYKNIWYLADGVYSMFGDLAPLDVLEDLLNRYPQFHLYIDDAHGVSCFGKHGRGYVLDRLPIRERMIVAISLCKGFGGSGGGLVFPDQEMKRRARVCGGPMTFSGPIQPPMLGAILASARIHLTDEINDRQRDLREKMELCNRLLREYNLPVVDPSIAPIRYIGMGLPRIAFNMINRLMEEGFYANTGLFPAVPMKRGGVRFTLTHYQTQQDIEDFIKALAKHFPAVLEEEESSLDEIKMSFRRALPQAFLESAAPVKKSPAPSGGLLLQHATTIQALEKEEWDRLLGGKGTFTWEGLRFLEDTFRENQEPENNWNFHYFIVRDPEGCPLLATFFTDALWKDDMISPESTSYLVEQKRLLDPYFLTSRTFSMGSLLTEGNHLYLDRKGDWRQSLTLLLKAVESERERCGASNVILRDLSSDDPEMDDFLLSQGFVKLPMPDSLVIDIDWQDEEEYLKKLAKDYRRYQRREVMPFRDAFETEVFRTGERIPSEADLERFYGLYSNVKSRGLLINTFTLPQKMFSNALNYPGWEMTFLHLKPEFGGPTDGSPVGASLAFCGEGHFVPLVIGLDYQYVQSHHSYRCFLDQARRRAEALDKKKILFGFGATLEKKRFGAKAHTPCLYAQAVDGYNTDILAQLMADSAKS
ncbi:MAG TPA: aminotransferase class I/II [Cyanobacteria bacterium UBA8530]|nr:aminotransferase class I/II [Cyanobacteria bacterium UBA8530]